MLAVSPLRNTSKDESKGETESFTFSSEEFPNFAGGNLHESIDFEDLLLGIDVEGDVLPDLEMDPELLAEFPATSSGEELEMNMMRKTDEDDNRKKEEENKVSSSKNENLNKRENPKVVKAPSKDGYKGRKSSSKAKNNNNNQGTRKVKVDWTPELHRRFVQAVEQLGVNKAVPSRILEIMGIDCLTRHNIASHLQKYRSHRKHLLAREAEAAIWIHRRQVYGEATPASGGAKQDMNLCLPPTMGFPPVHHQNHHFRPLHVWGHPTMDRSLIHLWSKHLAPHVTSPPPPPQPTWGPPPPAEPGFWHHRRVPNGEALGTPCYAPPLTAAPTRYGAVPVPGIPPHHAIYKADTGIGAPDVQLGRHPRLDFHPTKGSIDAAIGDVLSKPSLPLPIGLKPPSTDGVLAELQRQGVHKIPPSCA